MESIKMASVIIDWDNIDDKMLIEARDRVLRLMRHDFGFDKEHALGQALKEFPGVDCDHLKAIIVD